MPKPIEQRLMDLKARIERERLELAQKEGQLAEVMRRLQEQFGCASLKEAKAKRTALAKEREQREQELAEGLAALEERYMKPDQAATMISSFIKEARPKAK